MRRLHAGHSGRGKRDRSDPDPLARRRAEWVAAVNTGSLNRYTRLLSRDVFWLQPDLSALKGRDAVRAWLKPFLTQFEYDFVVSGPAVHASGDWAVECGQFASRLRPRTGGRWLRHTGVYIMVWQRGADGDWYLQHYLDVTALLPRVPIARATN